MWAIMIWALQECSFTRIDIKRGTHPVLTGRVIEKDNIPCNRQLWWWRSAHHLLPLQQIIQQFEEIELCATFLGVLLLILENDVSYYRVIRKRKNRLTYSLYLNTVETGSPWFNSFVLNKMKADARWLKTFSWPGLLGIASLLLPNSLRPPSHPVAHGFDLCACLLALFPHFSLAETKCWKNSRDAFPQTTADPPSWRSNSICFRFHCWVVLNALT